MSKANSTNGQTKKELTPKELANNLQSHAWAFEQRRKDILISLIPHDKYRELNEAISAAKILVKTAREKMHSIEHHGGELTMNRVDSIRSGLDRIYDDIHRLMRDITPTPDNERFDLSKYPLE